MSTVFVIVYHISLKMVVVWFRNILFEKLRDILEHDAAVLLYVSHGPLYDRSSHAHPPRCEIPAVGEGNLAVLPEP